ncbi:MAG: hypothetical protein IJ459_05460 [Clostridia bacterium]|nr:hypothetical protein [Clostridia bacterium]
MKRYFVLSLILIATVLLTSCALSGTGSEHSVNTPAEDPASSLESGEGAKGGLVSADSSSPVTPESTDVSVDYGTATVFTKGDNVQIIYADKAGSAVAGELLDAVSAVVGESGSAYLGSIYSQNQKNEIIIGHLDEERPATVKARKLLDRMERSAYFDARVAVYAESGCIAFAYDLNEYTNIQAVTYAVESFIEKHLSGREYLALGEGTVFTETYDLIELQADLDLVTSVREWAALEEAAGKDVAEAARTLYTLYTEDIVLWLANLYDPGVGGFYASSSGRDGDAFGPDLQCTVQLMRFITQSGLVKGISNDPTVFLPTEMQRQMIYFGKSLQDKNGFFYHPQWGKELTDTKLSRRGRDLNWGTSLLDSLDSAPTYTAADGTAGDGITADEYWASLGTDAPKPYTYDKSPVYQNGSIVYPTVTASLSSSLASAVSKVVTAASSDYLSDHVSFMNYLLDTVEPGLHSNPYATGNEVGSNTGHIAVVSDKLGAYEYSKSDDPKYARFDGMTLKEMLVSVLYENINPQTGLWGDLTAEKPNGTEFRYTNGFMKTVGIFTGWGYAYPAEYIPKVASALMAGIMGDEPSTTNICDIYNVWTCVGLLRSNMKNLDDPQLRESIEAEVAAILKEHAPAAILNTYEKLKGYKKYDGGFAHNYLKGTTHHQNLPVSLGLNQSDVDGTCIGTTGLTRAMFEALGLIEYKPSMYHEATWMQALEIFLSQGAVIKYSYDGGSNTLELHDYEEYMPDAKYLSVTNNGLTENVFERQTLDGKGGVGLYNKVTPGKQLYLDWRINSSETVANAAIFETEIMVCDLVESGQPIELRLYDGASASTRLYTLYINAKGKTAGTDVTIAPKSQSSKTVVVSKVGEWFKLSLVYFEATETSAATVKVYVNGQEAPVIVDEKLEATATSAKNVGFSRFITMGNFVGKIYLDNTRFVHEKLGLTDDKPTHNETEETLPSTPSTPSTPSNPSAPTTPEGSTSATLDGALTFDGATAFPVTGEDGLKIIDNKSNKWLGSLSFETEEGNTFLRITDPYRRDEDLGQLVLLFDRPDYSGSDNTFVFECKLRISACNGTLNNLMSLIDITFRGSSGSRAYRTYLGAGKLGLNSGKGVSAGYGTDEWFTVRIEYTVIGNSADSATFDVKAYVNNTLVSESSEVTIHEFCNSQSIDKVGLILSVDYAGYLDVDDIKLYQKSA